MVDANVIKPDLDKIIEPRDSSTNVKAALISGEKLCVFHPTLETIISADASSFRMGAVLRQRQPEGKALCPVAYIS